MQSLLYETKRLSSLHCKKESKHVSPYVSLIKNLYKHSGTSQADFMLAIKSEDFVGKELSLISNQ